jgi:hypothetical protein
MSALPSMGNSGQSVRGEAFFAPSGAAAPFSIRTGMGVSWSGSAR